MGQQSVGKTCLVDRYINSTFETAQKNTIGVAFAAKKVSLQTRSHTKNDFQCCRAAAPACARYDPAPRAAQSV